MAQVLPQKRGNPPYLLILTILLFLMATVLAVVFYVQSSDKGKQLAKAQEDNTSASTASNTARQEANKMAALVTGGANTQAKAAEARARTLLDKATAALGLPREDKSVITAGLAGAVDQLAEKITTVYQPQLADAAAQVTRLTEDNSKLTKTEAELKAKIEEDGRKYEADVAAAQKKDLDDIAAKDTQLNQAVADKDAIIKDKERQIAELSRAGELKDKDLAIRDARIDELMSLIQKLKGDKAQPGEAVTRLTDGKILKVQAEQNVCYIDLGEKDHITPGLPFSVYSSAGGIPEDGKGKAKIVVKNVSANTSECRIVESSKDDPIVDGDLIGNVIFSPTRNYNFVVEGDFDLYNTDKPDAAGTREVRTMIERFGGKLSDNVSVDTDFVVMGVEPERPAKPGADAPASDWQIYKDKIAKYEHYKNVKSTAVSLQIPVLNTNRFIALTGMMPKVRRTE
jgi:hypothetical protein